MNTTISFKLTHLKDDQYLMQEVGHAPVQIRADKDSFAADDERTRALYYSCRSFWSCTTETVRRNLLAVRKDGSKTFKANRVSVENLLDMWAKSRAWQERLAHDTVDIDLSGEDYVILDPCYIETELTHQPIPADASCYEEHLIGGYWSWRTIEGDGRYAAAIAGTVTDYISVDSGTMAIVPLSELEEMDVDYSGHMALAKNATHLHIENSVVTIATSMGDLTIELS